MSLVETIERDFKTRSGPFADYTKAPEVVALERAGVTENTLNFLTYGVMLDYNRKATRLWQNIAELYIYYSTAYFDPGAVTGMHRAEMQSDFEAIGFRYYNRDAKAWYTNSQIVLDEHGSWTELILASDRNATQIVDELNTIGITYLSGEKIAPLWIKMLHQHVVPIDGLWKLDIPVDVHIRRLTQRMLDDDELLDDEIRAEWHELYSSNTVDPALMDTALWIIGNRWNEWGEAYIETLEDDDDE